MIFLILFTIFIGALAGALLFQQKTNVSTTQLDAEVQKKKIDDMLKNWAKEGEETKKKQAERRIHLESSTNLTVEEQEERENMRAKELHQREQDEMNRGDIPYYSNVDLYSPEVRRKEEENRQEIKRRVEADRIKEVERRKKAGNTEEVPSFPDMPPLLGMTLCKTPNSRRWDAEAEARASAHVGMVFQWLAYDILTEPIQEMTFHLIRTNGSHRWIYLTVTREKTESVKDILADYLKTLDLGLFNGVLPVTVSS
jgi:hypothetical protein